MKPMGRRKVKFPCKRDVHPGKGWRNWWESMHLPSKGSERQKQKREDEGEARDFECKDG